MTVILSAALPAGDHNGLNAIADALVDDFTAPQMIVAAVCCKKVTTTTGSDSRKIVATARVLDIEALPVGTPGWRELRRLLDERRADRTGQVPLPLTAD